MHACSQVEAWGKTKPDGLKAKMTEAGKLPFGQVPLLTVDGEQHIVQSHAMLRYLGRHYGFYTGTAAQLAAVDLAADGTEDIRKQLMKIKYSGGTDDEKEAAYKSYFDGAAPTWFAFFENLLVQHADGFGFVAGTTDVSIADYLLFDLIDTHALLQPARTEQLLRRFPVMTGWHSAMASRPRIAKYLASPARRR